MRCLFGGVIMKNIDLTFRGYKYKFEAKCDNCFCCCAVEVVENSPEGFILVCSSCGNTLKMISKEPVPKQHDLVIPKGTTIIIPKGVCVIESIILPHDVVIKGENQWII